MLLTKEKQEIKDAISGFDRRIEEMHLAFQKYYGGEDNILPEWDRLERDILVFSRKKIVDLELSKQLDRVMYKFQNRKRIWLNWVDEAHRG